MIPNQCILASFFLGLTVPVAWAQSADPPPPTENAVPVLPGPPPVSLQPAEPPTKGLPNGRTTAARADALIARADAARNEAARYQLLLAAANEILAHQLAPACTARFLRIETDQVPADRELRDSLDRVDELLGKVEAGLNSHVPSAERPER